MSPAIDPTPLTAEHRRLADSSSDDAAWRLWGPYVADRQWGTVREDYSVDGDAWASFPFEHAHQRVYRWGEDGLAGICDRYGFLNLGIALWNGHDDRLKERLFGLTNAQGNHGEDVKEHWWHVDATPTHSYAQWLYRYPQAAYPYTELAAENASRGRDVPEYELADTGVLAEDRFVDVMVTHAKAAPDDIAVVVTATNQGPEHTELDLVPQLWFRNTWRWGDRHDGDVPTLRAVDGLVEGVVGVEAEHGFLGTYRLLAEGAPELLFCDNETNAVALYGAERNATPYPKDGIDRAIVHGDRSLLNPAGTGTKVGLRYHLALAPGETATVRLRLVAVSDVAPIDLSTVGAVTRARRSEADAFYAAVIPASVDEADRAVARRAFAGLLWNKQLYRYDVARWLDGDQGQPVPPASRLADEPAGRNTDWRHLYLADVISMPDSWEYPWFASWDLAFHTVALAHIDPAFAKSQLVLMCREWAQHPDGQLPAYEWSFSDVNPPVHAWAAWWVYQLDGAEDRAFLVRILGKLLVNFGWWVNRKDAAGSNLFEGGFLGMDNISAFDRSRDVPHGWLLEQSDATSWMAFSCLNLLSIALELARGDRAWEDVATMLLERFLAIASAMESFGSHGVSLWDEADGFFYDVLVCERDGVAEPVRVRSLVGLLPLLAVAPVPDWVASELPDFRLRMDWLLRNRPELADALSRQQPDDAGHRTLSLVPPDRYVRLLSRLFDEGEFWSLHGIRSLSAVHRGGTTVDVAGTAMSIRYDPGESSSNLFGGNSNWRGPVWFPPNVLLAGALRSYAATIDPETMVELPTGSGHRVPLPDAVDELERRLVGLFRPAADGRRPSDPRDHGTGPLWEPHPVFSEYFHGDTGIGLGASHQTGWTALVAHLICTPPVAPMPGYGGSVSPEARGAR